MYNLPPLEIGTPFVESLTSYIIRLAKVHNVTPGLLIGKEITPLLDKHYLNKTANRGGGGLYKSAASLNGLKLRALDLVSVLEKLTFRNDLLFTTLLTWSNVIPTRGLLRSQKAWCPVCIEEWRKNDSPIYEPLLWFFQDVMVCSKHKVALETSCPFCSKEIPVLSRNSCHGYCTFCREWLGQSKYEVIYNDEDQQLWYLWKANTIGELLKIMPSLKYIPIKNRIKNVLSKAIEECTNGVASRFAKLSHIPKSTFKSYIENKLPSISNLLTISFCSGVTLTQFLTAPLSQISFIIKPYPYNHVENLNKSSRFPPGYIVEKLEYWANSNSNPPPSITEIASLIGCDRRLLYMKAPELSKLISQKYLNYVTNRSKERKESVKIQVIEAVNCLNQKGLYPSANRVEEFIKMPGSLKEEAARIAWKEELKKMN